eukprot:1193727-Prorocentrum_minimum.AAC.4
MGDYPVQLTDEWDDTGSSQDSHATDVISMDGSTELETADPQYVRRALQKASQTLRNVVLKGESNPPEYA